MYVLGLRLQISHLRKHVIGCVNKNISKINKNKHLRNGVIVYKAMAPIRLNQKKREKEEVN